MPQSLGDVIPMPSPTQYFRLHRAARNVKFSVAQTRVKNAVPSPKTCCESWAKCREHECRRWIPAAGGSGEKNTEMLEPWWMMIKKSPYWNLWAFSPCRDFFTSQNFSEFWNCRYQLLFGCVWWRFRSPSCRFRSQLCINTAIVYMHRFYAFHSFTLFHRNSIAAAAFFLAAKVLVCPRARHAHSRNDPIVLVF